MIVYDMNGSNFVPDVARKLVADARRLGNDGLLKWVMHPAQESALENASLLASPLIVEHGKSLPDALSWPRPRTLGGLQVYIMDERPSDEISLVRMSDGELVGQIKNLARPFHERAYSMRRDLERLLQGCELTEGEGNVLIEYIRTLVRVPASK